jgi:hypothetical protein
MAVDTSSAAAGMIAVVGAAAVKWAAVRFEPITDRSLAAVVIISGTANMLFS